MVQKIGNLADYKKAIAGPGLVVVDFSAECFHKLADENKDVTFLNVDVDEAADVAEFCEIQAMPTFMFYKGGKKVDTFKGADPEKLKAMLAKHK